MPLLLAAIALIGLAAVAWVVVWRRLRVQRYYQRVERLIRERFPTLDEPLGDAHPLQAPPGEVSVQADGIHLRLGDEMVGHSRVPWSDINHVVPTGRGGVRVHISGIGDLSVPSAAGRQIWTAMNEARTSRGVGA